MEPDVRLPRVIENDCDYVDELRKSFDEYNKWIDYFTTKHAKIVLMMSNGIEKEPNWDSLKNEVKQIEDDILEAISEYYCGEIIRAQQGIYKILKRLIDGDELSFLVSDIDKSYATRGVAPFLDLQMKILDCSELYERMNNETLSFFRARIDDVESYTDMLHIPLNKRDSIGTQRFSVPGTPCLYLGTSSYDIWRELRRPAFDRFNVSAIKVKPVSERTKIKILNLTASKYLIYGLVAPFANAISEKAMDLVSVLIKIWVITCATSFRVKNQKGAFHSEYIVSHLIMQCLRELDIDGVAYFSKQITPNEEIYAWPVMVNIAIPVFSEVTNKKFAPICSKIEITDPINFQEFQGIDKFHLDKKSRCYISKTANEQNLPKIFYSKRMMEYHKTYFNWFDDFLSGQEYHNVYLD